MIKKHASSLLELMLLLPVLVMLLYGIATVGQLASLQIMVGENVEDIHLCEWQVMSRLRANYDYLNHNHDLNDDQSDYEDNYYSILRTYKRNDVDFMLTNDNHVLIQVNGSQRKNIIELQDDGIWKGKNYVKFELPIPTM